jgi:DNA-binding transcriptional LysR family regulator
MDLTKYEIFADAAKTGNFTKTADRMGYTQPGVSRTLRQLENELGFPLFQQERNGVSLTSTGRQILPYVRRLLAENKILEQQIAEINGLHKGHLTIACFASVSRVLMPHYLSLFRQRYPHISVELMEGGTDDIVRWVSDSVADFGILSHRHTDGLQWMSLWQDPLMAVLPKEMPRPLKKSLYILSIGTDATPWHLYRFSCIIEAGNQPSIRSEGHMLQEYQQLKISEYQNLYDRLIPEDHVLRKFNNLVDFSFVRDELEHKYCLDNGRNAISPVMLFKYLILKAYYTMSDADLVERSKYDMSFKYFLGLRPEDDVIHSSTLTKFRKLRLADENILDLLIEKTVAIAIEKGIIKEKRIIVDATHTKARYNQKSAYQALGDHAKLLRKTVYRYVSPEEKNAMPKKRENGILEDQLDYCKELIAHIEKDEGIASIPAVQEKLNLLKEATEDNLEHLTESKDRDARIGHKTADTSFFGYKTHIAMTDERIITAAVVTSGEKGDGQQLEALVEKTRKAGLEVKDVIGDTAYSGKQNLELAESKDNPEKAFRLISKLHPIISNTRQEEGEKGFTYNKDAAMYVCPAGHMAIRKAHTGKKNQDKNQVMTYYFDVERCHLCPQAQGCYKDGAKSKTYNVTIKSGLHKKQAEFQETESFKELARTRYKIEAKNSELKHRHGYDVASSSGLVGMQLQGATTIFVTNLKRIIALGG